MRALVATQATQGRRITDYCLASDHELLTYGPMCSPQGQSPWKSQLILVGLQSGLPTTTMQVAEVDLTPPQYIDAIYSYIQRTKWMMSDRPRVIGLVPAQILAVEIATELLHVAKSYPTGTVLERRGPHYRPREEAS
jgi:hypothetical protein